MFLVSNNEVARLGKHN